MRILSLCCALFLLSGTAAATTYHVPDDFTTINDAFIHPMVTDGDRIVVRPGTYHENINFNGKSLALVSEMGPEVTVLMGNELDSVVTIDNQEGHGTVLGGFTITNGSGKPC